jgi:hypothetical protein
MREGILAICCLAEQFTVSSRMDSVENIVQELYTRRFLTLPPILGKHGRQNLGIGILQPSCIVIFGTHYVCVLIGLNLFTSVAL